MTYALHSTHACLVPTATLAHDFSLLGDGVDPTTAGRDVRFPSRGLIS